MSGTRARCASTTAACTSAAAVPLVVTSTAGRPVARPMPTAKKAADRSSRRTWRAMRPSRARATASGVEREPGSQDGVGQPGAHPLVDERGREASRYRHRPMTFEQRRRTGRRSTGVRHCIGRGGTARGSCSSTGSPRRALVGRHRRGARGRLRGGRRSTFPATGARPLPDAGLRTSPKQPGPSAHAGGRATYVGYSLGGRCCLQLALAAPRARRAPRRRRGPPGHRRRDGAAGCAARPTSRLAPELERGRRRGRAGVPRQPGSPDRSSPT